jgi:hypothetical protein
MLACWKKNVPERCSASELHSLLQALRDEREGIRHDDKEEEREEEPEDPYDVNEETRI